MHGKIIQFKAEIDNFKVKNGLVTVNLTADTKDIVLDQLSEISSGPVMVNLERYLSFTFIIRTYFNN